MAEKEAFERLMKVVNEQAEDEGLWFVPLTGAEDYLKQAFRRLHDVIELEFKNLGEDNAST